MSAINTYTSKHYLMCGTCFSKFRLECLGPSMTGPHNGRFRCPLCGGLCHSHTDSDQDYWYSLAESLGFPATEEGATLAKGLYDLWEPNEHSLFKDFVEAFKNDP